MLNQLVNFFVSNAYADAAGSVVGGNADGGGYSFLIMFVVLFAFIYFGIWRPQNKRAKEQRQLLDSLAKGDEVVTAGGLLGRISKINNQHIIISIANNVEIVMQKSAVISVLPKGTLKTIE